MSLKRELFISIFSNWAGTLIRYVLALVATPIIVHSLGNEIYGIWSLAISVTGYFGIIDFGIRSTTIKLFSEYETKKDISKCNVIVNTVTIVCILIAIVVLYISIFIAFNSDLLFKTSIENRADMMIVFLLVGCNLALSFVFKTFNSIIISLRRFDINTGIKIFYAIIRTLLIILFLKLGYSLITMALIVVISDLVANFTYMLISFRLFPELKIDFKLFNWATIKENFVFAGFNFMIHISRIISEKTDQILIGYFIGVQYIVFYSIAQSLVNYVRKIPTGIIRTIMPFASHLNAKGADANMEAFLYIIPKYTLSFFLITYFIFYEFGYDIVSIWMGNGYEDSYPILIILLFSELAINVTNIICHVYVGLGKNKIYALLNFSEMIFHISLSIVLIKYWGLVGVALGALVPVVINRGIILPFLLNKMETFSTAKYLIKTITPTIVSFLIFFLLYRLTNILFFSSNKSIFSIMLNIVYGCTIYMIVCYFITFKEIRFNGKKFSVKV